MTPEPVPSDPSAFPIDTIDQLIAEKAAANGGDTFLVEAATGESLTYRGTLEAADGVGASLQGLGVGKGDVVATALPNAIDHALVWFGCMRIGAVWAPMNPEFEPDELAHALSTVEPTAAVVGREAEDAYGSVEEGDVEHEFVGDESPDALLGGDGSPAAVEVAPGDPAILCFTGGTTGMPKAVLHSQFAPLTGAYRYGTIYNTTPEDRHLGLLKFFHVGGQQFGVLGPMMADMRSVVLQEFSASSFFDQVNEHEATITAPVGSVLGILVNTYDEPVENTLRWIASGWQVREIARRARELFDVRLMGGWALTEGGGIKLTNVPFEESRDCDLDGEGEPVGRIGEWGALAILDEDGEAVPPDTVGEICIRPTIAHSMMERYYNDPGTTVETWDGLWIHTGDLGRIDGEGMLYFVGRQSHFIRVRGENVSAVEVETVVGEHPAVDEAAVVGVSNTEIGGEDVKAYVVPGGDLEPGDVLEWCDGRLSAHKIPRYVEFVDALPRSDTKKDVRRDVLRDRGVGGAWDARDR